MTQAHNFVFILWGEQCEELPTTVFVTELRAAGLPVKVVGLSGPRAAGTHSLAIVPDMTLGQALPLARQATCIIVPCESAVLQRLANDPRLSEFLAAASANRAYFITGQLDNDILPEIGLRHRPEHLHTYPRGTALIDFAHQLGQQFRHS